MDNKILEWILHRIQNLPNIIDFDIPSGVYTGINNITSLLGWIMPYNLYMPLLMFILSFTAFQVVYAIYMSTKK